MFHRDRRKHADETSMAAKIGSALGGADTDAELAAGSAAPRAATSEREVFCIAPSDVRRHAVAELHGRRECVVCCGPKKRRALC
jgi:hypothetical protein